MKRIFYSITNKILVGGNEITTTENRIDCCLNEDLENVVFRLKQIADGGVVTIEDIPDPRPLHEIQSERIAQSKVDLAVYLESHPLQWTDGEYYSITAEKQQQLTSKIMAATMAQSLSTNYNLTWNSTGKVCKEWTLQDLSALAFAIDSRVTALVSYQQTQEVAMRNATTQEELDSIVVDYDSVPIPGGAT